ncbi:hypothetical protein [Streptodolium elevatio]|uniref:Uncharacterized protein n=1 Tax=Streptodolium elevatio TaxID=3157996 RepID=A0ABV3DLK1_9ACTN
MAGDLPLIDALIDGMPRRAELICYVDTADGRKGRICWYERVGDSDPEPVTVTLPEVLLIDVPGVDYGDVPVIEAEARRTGRVATGWDWRRTG